MQALIASATDSQIPVLSEELDSYLSSRGLPTAWLPQALSTRIPGLSDATADATLKARQLAIVQHNNGALTHSFQKGIPAR